MNNSPAPQTPAADPEQDKLMDATRFAMLAAAARGDFRAAARWFSTRAALRRQEGRPS